MADYPNKDISQVVYLLIRVFEELQFELHHILVSKGKRRGIFHTEMGCVELGDL